jgi:hypothetical protein
MFTHELKWRRGFLRRIIIRSTLTMAYNAKTVASYMYRNPHYALPLRGFRPQKLHICLRIRDYSQVLFLQFSSC